MIIWSTDKSHQLTKSAVSPDQLFCLISCFTRSDVLPDQLITQICCFTWSYFFTRSVSLTDLLFYLISCSTRSDLLLNQLFYLISSPTRSAVLQDLLLYLISCSLSWNFPFSLWSIFSFENSSLISASIDAIAASRSLREAAFSPKLKY